MENAVINNTKKNVEGKNDKYKTKESTDLVDVTLFPIIILSSTYVHIANAYPLVN